MTIDRKKIEKDFGKRCTECVPLCIVCEVHRALDVLEFAYEIGDWKPKNKKK